MVLAVHVANGLYSLCVQSIGFCESRWRRVLLLMVQQVDATSKRVWEFARVLPAAAASITVARVALAERWRKLA